MKNDKENESLNNAIHYIQMYNFTTNFENYIKVKLKHAIIKTLILLSLFISPLILSN